MLWNHACISFCTTSDYCITPYVHYCPYLVSIPALIQYTPSSFIASHLLHSAGGGRCWWHMMDLLRSSDIDSVEQRLQSMFARDPIHRRELSSQ